MATITDLGRQVKLKYPGVYDDLADDALGALVKQKYPGSYDDYEGIFISPKKIKATPRSIVSKVLRGGESVLGVAASPTAKHLLGPLAESLPISKEAKAKIAALRSGKETVYGSDILEQIFPGALAIEPAYEPKIGITGEKLKPTGIREHAKGLINVAKVGARIGVDIFADPLAYVGLGLPTKLGRLLRIVREAKQAGKTIKLSSPLAKQIAKEVGAAKPSAQMINKFLKQLPSKTFSQQVAKRERSLVSVGLPFGKVETPLLTGKLAGQIVKPLSLGRRGVIGAKIENAVRDLLSTKSGDPDFDVLLSKYRSVVGHRAGIAMEEASVLNRNLRDISREMGIPREEVEKQIRGVLEAIKIPEKIVKGRVIRGGKAIYPKDIFNALDADYTNSLVTAKVGLANAQKANDAAKVDLYAKQVTEYQSSLNELRGNYTPPANIDLRIDKVAREQRAASANQLLRQEAAGLPSKPLMADIGYLPHILTNETISSMVAELKAAGKFLPKMTPKELNEQLANTIRRQLVEVKPIVIDAWKNVGLISKRDAKTIKGKNGIDKLDELLDSGIITEGQYTNAVHTLTIDEVQNLPKELKEKIFGKNIGDAQIFHSDPVYATAIRAIRGERAITGAEFFSEMKARKLAIPDATAPQDWVNVKTSELAGHKVSPDAARVLNKWNEFVTNPREFRDALVAYDKFHAITKAWALGIFPGYHSKNMVGNFWNNWLAGLNNPDRYREAFNAQTGKGKTEFTDIFGTRWNNERILREGSELGIIGRGQYASDIEHTLKQYIERGEFRWKDLVTPSQRNLWLKAGFKVGTFIENNARLALFIDRLRKGDTAEQAALLVKKFLFDYGDYTDFERNVLNRVFFFYKWTRSNIPLQLHALVTTPWKFSVPYKAKHETEKLVIPAPEKYLPEWMKENFPLRIRYDSKTKKYEYFMLNNWLPAADLAKVAHIHDIAAQMLAPLPKELLQQLWNYDFYFKQQIQTIPGQKTRFLGVDTPTWIAHGLKVIRLLNEIDKMTKEDSDLYTKMLQFLTSKNYSFNPTQAMITNKRRVDEELRALTSQMYREALKKPMNKKEIERIKAMIREKYREY